MLTPGIITNQKTTMTIQKNVAGYWDTRAEGYSLRTIDEIKSPKGEAWVKRIKELLALPAGSAVADMGCGAGLRPPDLTRQKECLKKHAPMRRRSD